VAWGVPDGAASANHDTTCKPGRPASAVVGTSGSCDKRCGPAIAKAFTRPDWICGSKAGGESMAPVTVPDKTAAPDSAPPLYGTCVVLILVSALNKAAPACGVVPLPGELKKIFSGFFQIGRAHV